MTWDPQCYSKFKNERSAPFEDLVKLIKIREGLRVIDLGCGTGELTSRLADLLPGSEVLGIDSSAEMLEQAYSRIRPRLKFEKVSIENVKGDRDLVFSNAAIQWLGGHATLVPRLFSMVTPGGQICIQLPSNFAHPSHALLREVAEQEPFRAFGTSDRGFSVLSIDQYAELLYRNGAVDITAFEKIYPHVLPDADGVFNWMRGTGVLVFLDRLPPSLHESFLENYRARLRRQWPAGPVFFGFKRTLFAASRPV
jgi:trans-aconitate 2-methyltransferase